jgi:hypothetical protein
MAVFWVVGPCSLVEYYYVIIIIYRENKIVMWLRNYIYLFLFISMYRHYLYLLTFIVHYLTTKSRVAESV